MRGMIAIGVVAGLLLAGIAAARSQGMLLMYGGSGGAPPIVDCTPDVNLSTKFNNKCSSIFMRR